MKKVFLYFLIISIFSCKPYNLDIFGKRRVNFKLLKKGGVIIDTLKVRTDGVYLGSFFSHYEGYENDSIEIFSFNRYFNNGRYYHSGFYHDSIKYNEYDNLNNGYLGHYQVKGDTLITESYTSRQGYYYNYYQVNDYGMIKYIGMRYRTIFSKGAMHKSQFPEKWKKRDFKKIDLQSEPDW